MMGVFLSEKTYIQVDGAAPEASPIGATLEALASTIASRKNAGEESYTYRLLSGEEAHLLGKVTEEAAEVAQAATEHSASGSDADGDHLRYEAADVVYHLMVVLERHGISLDEFAAELNSRMTQEELAARPGALLLKPEHINRGK